MKKIIFGGSFDPIHLGHLNIANRALAFSDNVVFVPCNINPLGKKPQASSKDRLKMLEIATKNEKRFSISDIEIKRRGKSFTIDTINSLMDGNEKIGLLLGYDSFLSIDQWKNTEEILKKTKLFIFKRPGINIDRVKELLKSQLLKKADYELIDEKSFNISSTQVKIYAYLNEDISCFIPADIAEYITAKKIYQIKEEIPSLHHG